MFSTYFHNLLLFLVLLLFSRVHVQSSYCKVDCQQFQYLNPQKYLDCMNAKDDCGLDSDQITGFIIICGAVALLLVCICIGCCCRSLQSKRMLTGRLFPPTNSWQRPERPIQDYSHNNNRFDSPPDYACTNYGVHEEELPPPPYECVTTGNPGKS